MGRNPDSTRKKLLENRRVISDEFYWASRDLEGFFGLCYDVERQRFRGLRFYEVFDIQQWLEVLFSFYGVVETSVSDAF